MKTATPVADNLTAYTAEETRAHFLDHARMIARYWAGVDLERTRLPTQPPLTPIQERLERAEGAVFSMLTLIDGCTEFPAVLLSIETHPTDEDFLRSAGSRWYEDGLAFNGSVHLHDELGHGAAVGLNSIADIITRLSVEDRLTVLNKLRLSLCLGCGQDLKPTVGVQSLLSCNCQGAR